MNFRIWAILIAITFQVSGTAAAQKVTELRRQESAIPTAECVRKAMKEPLSIYSPLKPPSQMTQADRDRIKREAEAVKQQQSAKLKSCLTELEVYFLGWFEFLETVAVDKCQLKRTDALRTHADEDDADTDLLNGAATWEPIKDKVDGLPFFRGQSHARNNYRTAPLAMMCDDLKRGFGPNGDRFPGLVR